MILWSSSPKTEEIISQIWSQSSFYPIPLLYSPFLHSVQDFWVPILNSTCWHFFNVRMTCLFSKDQWRKEPVCCLNLFPHYLCCYYVSFVTRPHCKPWECILITFAILWADLAVPSSHKMYRIRWGKYRVCSYNYLQVWRLPVILLGSAYGETQGEQSFRGWALCSITTHGDFV